VRVWKLSGKYYYPGNFGEIFDKKVQFWPHLRIMVSILLLSSWISGTDIDIWPWNLFTNTHICEDCLTKLWAGSEASHSYFLTLFHSHRHYQGLFH
jgi:hypothetical protein